MTSQDPRSPDGEMVVRELGERLAAAFSRPGREALFLHRGRVELVRTRTEVVNSLGLSVGWSRSFASVSIHVTGSGRNGTSNSSRGEPSSGALHPRDPSLETSSMRYSALVDDPRQLDAVHFSEEACWRCAAAIGGRPAQGKGVPVLLDPRSAAIWVRSLIPCFVEPAWAGPGIARNGETPDTGAGERSGTTATVRPSAEPRRSPVRVDGLDLLDDPGGSHASPERSSVFDGEGRALRERCLVKDGIPVGRFVDSRDPGAPEWELGPMRRDSYRDRPEPGPSRICLATGHATREKLLGEMERGLFVTGMRPHSVPGAAYLVAAVQGIWIEGGKAVRPVARTLLVLPAIEGLGAVVQRGADAELDAEGPPVVTPSLLFAGADLRPL